MNLLSGNVALADETGEQVIAKLSFKDLTPGLTKAIAEVAPLVKVTISSGENLRVVVAKHCARDDAHFLSLLREKAALLGIPPDQVTADYTFPSARTLELPYCLRLSPTVKHTPLPNVPNKYKIDYATSGSRTYPASGGVLWSGVPGTTYPVSNFPDDGYAEWYIIRDQKRDAGWPVVVKLDEPEYIAIPVRSGLRPELAIASLNSEASPKEKFRTAQKGIQHITVLTSGEDRCLALLPDKLPENYPVDTYAVLRVLGLNAAARPSIKAGILPIIIGDSGLYFEPLSGIFTQRNVDTDEFAKMTPNTTYVRRHHGTYVASAALGGPYFMRFWQRLDPPVVIRARNIISKNCRAVPTANASATGSQDYCDVDDEGLSQIMSAGSTGAIVNLSVSHSGAIAALTNELLRTDDRFLIIVAAGNSGKEIEGDSYPAMLANDRRFERFVLVVGALESNGKRLSKNSSYHSSLVELAAYGCRIPVYEHLGGTTGDPQRFKIVPQSGTSMAAPLVSFAAALLRQQMDMSPSLLKKRLLISADYEPSLEEDFDGSRRGAKVKNNAKLNIPRALALYHDVVDLQDGRRIYGRLKDGENFVLALCGGQKAKRRSELRSLSIYAEDGKKMAFFYHGDANDQNKPDAILKSEKCPLSQPNPNNEGVDLAAYELTVEDAETGGKVGFVLGNVSNVTLAHKPYWEN